MNRLVLLLLLLLIGCGYNRFDGLPVSEIQAWEPTSSIGALVEGRVTQTIVVQGVVTTSDSTSNFYKELLVEHGAVLRLSVGMYDLCALYPRGTTLAIRIEAGSSMERAEDGVLTLTLPAHFNSLNQTLHRQPYRLEWSIPTATLDQLNNRSSGTTVRIVGVRFAKMGVFSGEATIEQGRNSAKLTTSPYALFATQKLPAGPFDLVAVWVGGKLKISDPATDITPW